MPKNNPFGYNTPFDPKSGVKGKGKPMPKKGKPFPPKKSTKKGK